MLNNKIFFLALFALVYVAASDRLVGGARELSGEELETAVADLDVTLSKLATADSSSYKATKVTKVTTQVVAGTLRTYFVELTDGDVPKDCTVKVWTRPWLSDNGTNVTLECDDETKLNRTW